MDAHPLKPLLAPRSLIVLTDPPGQRSSEAERQLEVSHHARLFRSADREERQLKRGADPTSNDPRPDGLVPPDEQTEGEHPGLRRHLLDAEVDRARGRVDTCADLEAKPAAQHRQAPQHAHGGRW